MREIAIRAGRGNISSSTVHNVFRSSRVPRWAFLEQVVNALGGALDREEFLILWESAWRAEQEANQSRAGLNDAVPTTLGRVGQYPERAAWAAPQAVSSRGTEAPTRPAQRIWSSEIPDRNLNFTGRTAELETLRRKLDNQRLPRVQVISGMGGLGKTELATEYIHQNIDRYDIIWWIRAEHHDRVREALVKLARRLELRQATTDVSRDRIIAAVLEALQSEARPSWLLVYDNAANPLDLQKYLPASRPGGHVIVTSREPNWPSYVVADGIELAPFTPAEAISFLRHRVPSLAEHDGRDPVNPEEGARRADEAARLAEELGGLPIAVGHAAAYLHETGRSVDEYLTRFAQNAHQLLSEQHGDADLPVHVSATWALSSELLTDDAKHLFNLCAFFSPEPVAAELFRQDATDIDDPPGLREFLSSPQRFGAAESQLHRLSLARVDGAHDLIQVHRVVQAVTQGHLRKEQISQFHAYRSAVDTLLAKSNPRNPDHSDGDATYDLSLQHLESDHRFLRTSNSGLRDLIIDQTRRLHLRGAHVEAMQFGQDALNVWREIHGEGDLKVLTMAVEVAVAMYMGGHVADAHELILRTRPLLQRHKDGEGFKALLLCETIYGADLRARSQFREALELDLSTLSKCEVAFGIEHERTLNVRNNVAEDYRSLGRFQEALETDMDTLRGRSKILGANALFTLFSSSAVARDLRGLGRYQESLNASRKAVVAFGVVGRETPHWLAACQGFATALRKAGYHWDALQESEHVLQRCRDYLGLDHMHTLRAAVNLVNDRRAVGDLAGAEELARETRDLCLGSHPPEDLLYAALLNLASVLRVAARPDEALSYDQQARNGLIRIHGDHHPFTLAANINYAADLAACGRLGDAIQVGRETLAKCRTSLGDEHPDTLMAAVNLAMDEGAAGDRTVAELLLAEAMHHYGQTLTVEHPEARAAARGTRLTAEIEPYDI